MSCPNYSSDCGVKMLVRSSKGLSMTPALPSHLTTRQPGVKVRLAERTRIHCPVGWSVELEEWHGRATRRRMCLL